MSKIYDWIDKHRKATRILALVIPTILIAVLTVPVILFIPGLLDNLRELHRLNTAGFYVFVVAPAAIAAGSALIWSLGDGWERMGKALYPDEEQGGED